MGQPCVMFTWDSFSWTWMSFAQSGLPVHGSIVSG
ncbi:hypothetical protein D915_010475 [Fasciola hepatica]|uniref:Uncharacterized protein n=1 Tax=Fasciola hepatica TaxID=6192 RepID=A0A4E0RA40_FASHE|nr:hypothetical protein D915_010475 [Fasciola hepatica]